MLPAGVVIPCMNATEPCGCSSTPICGSIASINGNRKSTDGYSLVPVNVWSHSVADVVAVAQGLEKLGNFEIVTPSGLLEDVAKYCGPGRHHTS